MKKSKLTGTLAVGGGLKYAVVPYIITGEENNGYSKGDILDANYVKQLINNVIPNNISADTLELHSGTISTDNGFGIFDKTLNKYSISNYLGTTTFNDGFGSYMVCNSGLHQLNSDIINISGEELHASLNLINMILGGSQINLFKDVWELPTGRIYFNKKPGDFTIDWNGCSISLNSIFTILASGGLRMGNGDTSDVTLFYSNDGSGLYKSGDPVILWDDSLLQMDKIYKPTQNISSEKDLFERVSDLETPKTTREDNPKVGQCVFDTTLGKPIWCKTAKTDTTAAVWVDATGATV